MPSIHRVLVKGLLFFLVAARLSFEVQANPAACTPLTITITDNTAGTLFSFQPSEINLAASYLSGDNLEIMAQGTIHVATSGSYVFTLISGGDSWYQLDGGGFNNLGVTAGSPFTLSLTAGEHDFDLWSYVDPSVGQTAELKLSLPSGVSFGCPDSSQFLFLAPALLCLVDYIRRRKQGGCAV